MKCPSAAELKKRVKPKDAVVAARGSMAIFALLVTLLAGAMLAGTYCQMLRDIIRQDPEFFGIHSGLPLETRKELLSDWDEGVRKAKTLLKTLTLTMMFGLLTVATSAVLALFTYQPAWRERGLFAKVNRYSWTKYLGKVSWDMVFGGVFFILIITLASMDLHDHKFHRIDSMVPSLHVPRAIVFLGSLLVVLLAVAGALSLWAKKQLKRGSRFTGPLGGTCLPSLLMSSLVDDHTV